MNITRTVKLNYVECTNCINKLEQYLIDIFLKSKESYTNNSIIIYNKESDMVFFIFNTDFNALYYNSKVYEDYHNKYINNDLETIKHMMNFEENITYFFSEWCNINISYIFETPVKMKYSTI